MNIHAITPDVLAIGYLLLLIPAALVLWLRMGMLGELMLATLRMTVQLTFVGLYLHLLFDLNAPWLNLLWIGAMILIADLSVLRSCGLRIRPFALPVFLALLLGTAIPLGVMLVGVLRRDPMLDAQYTIPLAGMVLGNCLRADIVGIRDFYRSLHTHQKTYHLALAQGATVNEAVRPWLRDALRAAMAPTIATMATIGLVSLPGLMTGVILAGTNPATAIRYQILIMLAILAGIAIAVPAAILLSLRYAVDAWGQARAAAFKTDA